MEEGLNGNGVEKEIRALEAEMRKRYRERAPTVLRPPDSVYRSYKVPPFWRKAKRMFQWGGALWVFYLLFFPAHESVLLEGRLIAREMRRIDAKVAGEVISLTKSNGDFVSKGEVIGRMHSPFLHQELARLRAEIEVLKTELGGIRTNLEIQEKLFASYRRLFYLGGISRMKLEIEKMKVKEAKTMGLDVKEAELRERGVRLRNLEARLRDEIIVSPFEGILTSPLEEKLHAQVREGETLAEGAFGGMLFEFRVREEAVRSIDAEQVVWVNLEAFPGKKLKGKVEEIRPIVFEDNPKPWIKAYNARILVSSLEPLPSGARLGMTAKSRIHLKHRRSPALAWLKEWKTRLGN